MLQRMLLRQVLGRFKSKGTKTLPLTSKFECLPNELIFLIFDYLHCHEIIYAFINLNNRFQSLLYSYSSYHLSNSPQLTKSKFKLVQQLPLNIENVKSLTLFYKIDSIILVDQFLPFYPIDRFYKKLKALSFNIDEDLSYSLILKLQNFQRLTYLSIITVKKHHRSSTFAAKHISNIILFKMRTLKYFKTNASLTFVNINSEQESTIEHFQLYRLSFDQLKWLYLHTFNLKSMSIEETPYQYDDYQPQTFERLFSLKLNTISSLEHIQWIFEHFQNLGQLKQLEFQGEFSSENKPIDGYQWENSIRQYIPQLEIFRFFFIICNINTLTNINELLASFQTDFWLIEKQWFITFNHKKISNTLFYYTEPCIRSNLEYTYPSMQISTATQTNNSTIDQLTLSDINSAFLRSLDHFSKIRSLTLSNISPNVTYDQLNRCVNLSSIKRLDWQSETNFQLLVDILNHSSIDIIFRIGYPHLLQIYQGQRGHIQYLESVKSLEITYHSDNDSDKEAIRRWCSYFPNIQALFLPEGFTDLEISDIMGSLQSLSFLVIHYPEYRCITHEYFKEQLLTNQNNRFRKKKILYRWSEDKLYMWLE